jgi:hypothetical protein
MFLFSAEVIQFFEYYKVLLYLIFAVTILTSQL